MDTGTKRDTRVPPHNLDAEESLLGAMLLSRDAIIAALDTRVDTTDFYKPAHGHVYGAIVNLHQHGEGVDVVTVAAELERVDLIEFVGGIAALRWLHAATPASANAHTYARIVSELATLRRLIAVSGDISEVAYDGGDAGAAHEQALGLLTSVPVRSRPSKLLSGGTFLLDRAEGVPARWGDGDRVAWARGESMFIVGPAGAGKTTMAALVATELARHRADRVLAADADAELGSLPLRLGVHSQLSLFDLAARAPHTFEEAERFLTRTPDGLYVLSSTRGGRIAGEFTLETLEAALGAVSRYVAATIVDCGAGILTEVNRGVIAGSHGLVLVTPGTVDGALSARGALEWFAANNQQALLTRTVIAMVSHAPQVGADLQRAHQMLSAWGPPVVLVPYDRQLATGSSLDMSRISAAARTAVLRVVHEVFSRSLAAGVTR